MEKANENHSTRLVSIQEAARYLGTSAQTLRRKTKGVNPEWSIPELAMGGRVKFDIRDLDEFIQNKKAAGS